MDALEYKQWQETFQSKARNATDDEIQFALNDIRETLATLGDIREALACDPSDYYAQKLLLERDEFLNEAGKRVAVELKNAWRS